MGIQPFVTRNRFRSTLLAIVALLSFSFFSFSAAQGPATALDFDGVDDTVTIPTFTNAPLLNSARTVEAWIKIPSTFTGYGMVFAYGGPDGTAYYYQRLSVGVQNGAITVESNNSTVTWPATVNNNAWHHLAFVYAGSGGIAAASVYLDGTALTGPTSSKGTTALATVSGPAFLGSLNGTSFFLPGTIDEVRVWNVARTQAEIRAAKATELAGNEANLVAYYQLNAGVAGGTNTGVTTANDLTTGASTGTLSGLP